jgi:hypothetical protein
LTTPSVVRRWLIAALVLGLLGTIAELLLLEHYEEGWQMTPLVLIAAALVALAWDAARPSARTVRAFQAIMGLFLVAGVVGVWLHLRGAAEFQREMDPSQPRWNVFAKAMRAKAPPVLAPGIMIQLGLIGLVSSYRAKE